MCIEREREGGSVMEFCVGVLRGDSGWRSCWLAMRWNFWSCGEARSCTNDMDLDRFVEFGVEVDRCLMQWEVLDVEVVHLTFRSF